MKKIKNSNSIEFISNLSLFFMGGENGRKEKGRKTNEESKK